MRFVGRIFNTVKPYQFMLNQCNSNKVRVCSDTKCYRTRIIINNLMLLVYKRGSKSEEQQVVKMVKSNPSNIRPDSHILLETLTYIRPVSRILLENYELYMTR